MTTRRLAVAAMGALLWTSVAAALEPSDAEPAEEREQWVIRSDTTVMDRQVWVERDVTVTGNATLRLENATLRLGGRLLIEEGSSLVLASSGAGPSSLGPFGSEPNFWIHVRGRLATEGPGPHVIEGMAGGEMIAGLSDGGIHIDGSAVLREAHLRSADGGVGVDESGSLELHDSTVSGVGPAGILALGKLNISNTRIESHNIGVAGRGSSCDVTLSAVSIDSKVENVISNGCRIVVADSILQGAAVSMTANNDATLEAYRTVIRDYTIDGLGSYAYPDTEGNMLRPTVRFQDVRFEPNASAARGADLIGLSLAEFHRVTMNGHKQHGIQAQTTALSIRDSTIQGNGGHGVQLAGGYFVEDPTASGNVWGSTTDGTANGKDALSHVVISRFWFLDAADKPVPGKASAEVLRKTDGAAVKPLSIRNQGDGTIEVLIQAYTHGNEGRPQELGPFAYRASHEHGASDWTGDVSARESVVLRVERPTPVEESRINWLLPVVAALVILPLVAYGAKFPLRRSRGR